MSARSHVPFEGLWAMPIELPYSLMLRDGDLGWSCGQLPLDENSNVLAPGNLTEQARITCGYIKEILLRAGLQPKALAKLVIYYVHDNPEGCAAMLDAVRECAGPEVLLVPVAVPHFYYEGLLIEIDAFTGAGKLGWELHRDSAGHFTMEVLHGAELTWTLFAIPHEDIHDNVSKSLLEVIAKAGLSADLLIDEHWFVGADAAAVWRDGAVTRGLRDADLLLDAGGATIVPDGAAGVRAALSFVNAPPQPVTITELVQRDVCISAREAGRFFWLSARCSAASLGLVAQTQCIMEEMDLFLEERTLSFANVAKSTTHYVGGDTAAELHDNMAVRNARYSKPGPASTGLPVAGLSDNASKTVIDLFLTRDL